MKKKKLWHLIVMLGFCIALSGCNDKLGAVDLSGKVELAHSNNGWSYRTIDNKSIYKSNLSKNTQLADYRHLLELDQQVKIGENEYYIVSRFEPKFNFFDYYIDFDDPAFREFQTQIYSFKTRRIIDTFVIKHSDTGDSWYTSVGFFSPKQKTNELKRRGVFETLFNVPSIKKDCLIYCDYNISAYAQRNVDKDDNKEDQKEKHRERNEFKSIIVKGTSQLKIGLRQCLAGTITVADKAIQVYVLDWDLDGKFTEADRVWSDYINEALPFGTEVRLTNSLQKSKDNTYILRLENPEADTYILDIQLASRAKS